MLSEKIDFEKLGPKQLFYKVLPHFILEIMTKYFRLKIEGVENIPKSGAALITPNHSGYSGFDAVLLSHHIQKKIGRVPRVLTHALWFLTKGTSIPMNKMGFIEATTPNGVKYLDKKQLVVLFPEGEHGNFKSSANAYKLQEFKRGFVRMALQTGAPIIPCLIIGAEETHINIAKLKLGKYLKGTVLPLPLNTLPLPAKWKIIFMEPIHLPYRKDKANDKELVHEIALDIRERMQKELSRHVKKRKNIFI